MVEIRTPDSARRSERSRRAILDAALALVHEVGYPRLTTEAIAARAGVGKQTIYRWWPSKAAVLLDAFVALVDEAAESGAAEVTDTGDLEADLKAGLRAVVDELNDPRYDLPARALASEGMINPGLRAEFVDRLLEPRLRPYVKRLSAAQDAGQISRDVDPRTVLELLLGPLTHRWWLRTRPLTHEHAEVIVRYVLPGLARG